MHIHRTIDLISIGVLLIASALAGTAADGTAVNGTVSAASYPGNDCGAKIMAADNALRTVPIEIWVSQACGTIWTTTVSVSANHTLRFVQGGVYTTSAGVVLAGAGSSVVGPPTAVGIGCPTCSQNGGATLQAAAGARLAAVLTMGPGYGTVADNIVVDGNKARGGTSLAGVAVKVDRSGRWELRHVTGQNANGHGLWVYSSAANNESCCGKMEGSFWILNGGDGEHITNTADLFTSQTEFEMNGGWGIGGTFPTLRMVNSDLGGNARGGVSCVANAQLYCTGTQFANNQFGGNGGHDIYIDGSVAEFSAYGHIFTGNYFAPNGFAARADNVSDAIHLVNAQATVSGNSFVGGGGSQRYKYFVSETNTLAPEPSTITGNSFNSGGFGTAIYSVFPESVIAGNREGGTGGRARGAGWAAPSISDGYTGTVTCLAGQHIHSLTVRGGIVMAVPKCN